jgi:hypothetical protein
LIAFLGLEGSLYRTVKMRGLVQASDLAQADALGFQALFDFLVVTLINLHEIGCHSLPPADAVV